MQVSDGGRTDTADLTVTLANLNEAPTANAGEDQTGIGEGAMVTLSGSGSDPDRHRRTDLRLDADGGPERAVSSIPRWRRRPSWRPYGSELGSHAHVHAKGDGTRRACTTRTRRRSGWFSSAPLTAVFEGVPAFHDGRRGFEVWLRFNREVRLNSAAFTNGLLTVDGGWVRRASRLTSEGTTLWKFTVMPWGDSGHRDHAAGGTRLRHEPGQSAHWTTGRWRPLPAQR